MNLNMKGAAILAVAAIGIAAGAYTLGAKQGPKEGKADPAPAATATAPVAAGLPSGHPATAPAATTSATTAGADPNAKFTHFRVGNRNVKSIYADGDLMWVGTSGGIIRYDTKTDEYKLYDNRSGLLSNGVFYVGKLGTQIAIGTYGGGLSLLDPATEKWTNYNVPHGLADAFVYEVLEARNGDIWIATWSGANRIRGGNLADRSAWDTYTVENTNGGLPNDWVYGLDEGTDGTIWLGTEGGLARFKDDKWENWQHEHGLGAKYELVKADIKFTSDPGKASSHHARQKTEQGLENVDIAYNPNYIISMEVDKEGVVWCGTWGGGLARFDGTTWTNFTVKDGIPSNHIFMLREDAAGQLWVGTSGGLVAFTEGSSKIYTTKDGLYSDNVFSMAEGSDNSRWVGSYGGVARIISLQ
ncbi:MAG: two-component regulator propeller domain-containing protein [Pseudomonadota bacterium]